MKIDKTLFTVAGIFAIALSACSGDNAGTVPTPEGMSSVSLQAYGKNFRIHVPDTNAFPLTIEEGSDGSLQLISGKNFAISVFEQAEDLSLRKEDITLDEVNRLGRIITETDSSLVWESAIVEPECHFVINRHIGGREYAFCDAHGNTFGEAAIQTMAQSAAAAHVE